MWLEVKTTIEASRESVWKTITDIEHSAQTIKAIEKIEVLEKPRTGFVGFKWKETRTLLGKTAQETMWITEASESEYYKTRAESHGSVYISTLELQSRDGATELTMCFKVQPASLSAKIIWGLCGFLFKGATRKALAQDLADIKAAVEGKPVTV